MRWERPPMLEATVSLPAWVRDLVDFDRRFAVDATRHGAEQFDDFFLRQVRSWRWNSSSWKSCAAGC